MLTIVIWWSICVYGVYTRFERQRLRTHIQMALESIELFPLLLLRAFCGLLLLLCIFFVDFFFCWLIFSFFLFVLLLFTYRNWTLFNSQRFNAQLNCLNSALIAIFLFLFRSCALSPHTVEMSDNCFFEV